MSRRRAAPPLPPAPEDLSQPSRAAWPGLSADVTAALGGAEIDYLQLADLLRSRDRLDQVRAVIATEGLTVLGSKAQLRPNPLLAIEAGLLRSLAADYARLGLDGKARWQLHVTEGGRLAKGNVGEW